jgi:hypothetical protein
MNQAVVSNVPGPFAWNIFAAPCVSLTEAENESAQRSIRNIEIQARRNNMEPIGFAAVVLAFSIPLAAIYAWYRVRKLRTEERLAAIAKGVSVPMADELPPHARSRKAAILLTAGGLGT